MARIDPTETGNTEPFECPNCNKKVQKVSRLDPDVGYLNRKTREFVQTCEKCWEDFPDEEKVLKSVFEAMFLVGIRADGQPPLISEEGIETDYKRSPTPFEIKAACKEIATNLDNMETANKVGGFLVQILQNSSGQQEQSKILLPRRKI